jgi:hypothetical protein
MQKVGTEHEYPAGTISRFQIRALSPFFAFFLLLLLAVARAQTPAQDDTIPPLDSEQKEILAHITENAMKYVDSLPDFVCNRITRRNVDSSGTGQSWRLLDTVNEEFSYVDDKEDHKILTINGKKVNNNDRVEGSTSVTEFGDLLSWIFDPKVKADFKWNSWTKLDGRRTYVFAYNVPQTRSQFTVGKHHTASGFAGLVWADQETNLVVRVSATTQNPPKSDIQNVVLELHYGFAKVGDRQFLLPASADFRTKDGKSLIWNEVEFRRCRKPGE